MHWTLVCGEKLITKVVKKTILLKGEYNATAADRGRGGNGGRKIVSFLKTDFNEHFPHTRSSHAQPVRREVLQQNSWEN